MQPQESSHRERLWTPWRMRYIGGDAKEDGCIFCNRLAVDDDVRSLILHRAEHAVVIMNLFPYNTGHVMVVPNTHAADLDALDDAALAEMATLLPRLLVALRRNLACDGFNIGLNLGSVAGAGVAEHLHQHVVPRWEGDANFMPILAGTMVIPEMIPSTYAKIRAELVRELYGTERFDIVPISGDSDAIWLRDGDMMTVDAEPRRPLWRTAIGMLGVESAEVVGWTGDTHAGRSDIRPGLAIRVEGRPDGESWEAVTLESAREHDPVRRGLDQMARWIAR